MKIRFLRGTAALLLTAVLMSGCGAAGAAENDASPAGSAEAAETAFVLEENEGRGAVSYPYVIRTASAAWYLSAADMEEMGGEAYREGMENLMRLAEQDFSDARAALKAYMPEDVPPVDIYMDFTERTEHAQWGIAGAIYDGRLERIWLYRDWELASFALLHEYVHFLSFRCCDFALREGFWAEGLADYIALFVCENRMAQSVRYHLNDESIAALREHGVITADGGLDPVRLYRAAAASAQAPESVGETYFPVAGSPMTMTERQQQHPLMTAVSYYEAACILDYLIGQYGEETVFAHLDCEQGDMESVYGMDFETLYFAWAEDNRVCCAELGIMFD